MEGLRVILLGANFELRLVSLVVRSLEVSDHVVIFDQGSNDGTIELAKKIDCDVVEYDGESRAIPLAKKSLELPGCKSTLIVKIDSRFKLRDLPLLINRARERWDVHMAFSAKETELSNPQEAIYAESEVVHMAASHEGLLALSKASNEESAIDLPEDLKVRVLYSKPVPKVQQRESLATASRFAQLFYWMLESKHPLLLFGIPGVVLFFVGYKLSGNVLDNFQEWNETTIGVGLAVIAVTLMGLFAMMVGLILYIMGKQVKQIQSQYDDWPKKM
ncbi:MAG: hypothetical protein QGI21_01190 [Candidatus Poseidoniaceae archaeon]|nr:hypothetical protein [Candidatus Poseidoniaceae archaeon]